MHQSSSQAGLMVATTAIILVFVIFLVIGFRNVLSNNEKALTRISAERTSVQSTPAVKSDYAYYAGPIDAKVTVTEFFDFQCAYSKQTVPLIQQLMDRYKDASVRFVFRQLPITATHPYAQAAALASLCAKDQNRFLDMYTAIFEQQDTLASEDFSPLAQSLGLSLPQFQNCISQNRYQGVIRKDLSDASSLGIQGTPTFFINDKVIEGAEPLDTFIQTIDSELAQ